MRHVLSLVILGWSAACTAPPPPPPEAIREIPRSFPLHGRPEDHEQSRRVRQALEPHGIHCGFESSKSVRADCYGTEAAWLAAEPALEALVAAGVLSTS